ncbi:MAG TPA: C1 family peptidase [Alloprevotella sp.]|nr:C1 family peptidase [Alloprevotella sp.]
MKKTFFVALSALCMLPGTTVAQDAAKKDSLVFTVVKENPITSVKDQNQSGTCWAYSSLGFFEAELLRMGKGEHDLCESFLVYNTYMDRADKAIRTHGDASFSQGGSFYDAVYCLKHYGMVPQDAMPAPGTLYGDSLFNFNQLSAVTDAYVGAIAKGNLKKISPVWKKDLSAIYENYFGKLPASFTHKGKTYTPQSYVKELGINPDDYVSLTSYTHHPFYSKFILEIQDNWRWAESYNLPLDEFMQVMDEGIRNGYSFAWGADVSEDGFRKNTRKGIAIVPSNAKSDDKTGSDAARWTGSNERNSIAPADNKGELTITQEMRQIGYDNWETTDDHGMVIYGLAKDQNGKEYFIMKNSWGDYGPYHGMCYISKPYVAYKTMNILIHKDAIPAKIAKKLGLK